MDIISGNNIEYSIGIMENGSYYSCGLGFRAVVSSPKPLSVLICNLLPRSAKGTKKS